jgi:hypothetical protein
LTFFLENEEYRPFDDLKKIFLTKNKKVSKNAEFHADFESVEKVVKKCTKKIQAKQV